MLLLPIMSEKLYQFLKTSSSPSMSRRMSLSFHALRQGTCGDRAFQNGRAIAKAGAPEATLAAMQDHLASGTHVPHIPTAVCNALRRIAVNDQICMEFADAGGLTVTMQVNTQCS